MKINKNELKELKRKELKKQNYRWIMQITLMAFAISFCFSFLSETFIPKAGLVLGIVILFIVILIGVIFDMIGVAVTSADEKPFHSMSARKVKGATVAVMFKKNADKVSSFCNDVIGDICGIISGSAGVIIATSLSKTLNINIFIVTLVVTALIAALTIGGKALGKSIAINKSNYILYEFAKFISNFYKKKGR